MPWIVPAIVAAGAIASTAASAARGRPSTRTDLRFPPETLELIENVELPLLRDFQGEQSALLRPFLSALPEDQTARQRTFGAPIARTVERATRRGAQDAGITDLGPTMEALSGLSPELLAALRELTLQRGAQERTIVPPGYGQFLSPQTFTQQSGGGPSAFQTGFQLAGAIAPVAASFFGGGGGG